MFEKRILGAIALAFLGLIWLVASLREIRLASASQDWPQAEGTVTAVTSKAVVRRKFGESREPAITKSMAFRISYSYAVDGVTYTGYRLYAGQWLPMSEFATRELSKRYTVGGTAPVFYDPDRPEESLLEPGFDGSFVIALVGGYFLLLVGVLIVRAGYKKASP